MPDLHQQIADLEAEIEALSDSAARVRKSIVVAKAVVAGGGLLLLAIVLGLFRLGPLAFLVSIAAVLGGIAFHGSSRSSLDGIAAAIRSRAIRRDAIIDALDPLAVEPSSGAAPGEPSAP